MGRPEDVATGGAVPRLRRSRLHYRTHLLCRQRLYRRTLGPARDDPAGHGTGCTCDFTRRRRIVSLVDCAAGATGCTAGRPIRPAPPMTSMTPAPRGAGMNACQPWPPLAPTARHGAACATWRGLGPSLRNHLTRRRVLHPGLVGGAAGVSPQPAPCGGQDRPGLSPCQQRPQHPCPGFTAQHALLAVRPGDRIALSGIGALTHRPGHPGPPFRIYFRMASGRIS